MFVCAFIMVSLKEKISKKSYYFLVTLEKKDEV